MEASSRAEQTTGSFAKELVRRAVLAAARHGVEPDDASLLSELDDLLSAQSALTRRLLGDGSEPDAGDEGGGDPAGAMRTKAAAALTEGTDATSFEGSYVPLSATSTFGWTAEVAGTGDVYRPHAGDLDAKSD